MAAVLLKADTGTTDDGETYQAYVLTGARSLSGQTDKLGHVKNPSMLVAKPSSGVTIQATVRRDYGLEALTSTLLLTAAGTENRVLRKFEGMTGADIGRLAVKLGDAAAIDNGWSLDYVIIPVSGDGAR